VAIANYFVLEELNRFPAVLARNIENCIGAPLVCVIACAFPHNPSLFNVTATYQPKSKSQLPKLL
jgi:hypothetical protein